MIPESFIQDLLARVDVVDVVGRYVQLRKGGANLLGLCPFHSEKSPSFTVSPTKQFYHCFGCGAHGTAISFLMEHTGASFPEAVRTLAGQVGMTVPEEPRSPRQQAETVRRKAEVSRHTQVLDQAQAYYLKQLRASPQAIAYLKQRGLTGEIAAHFGLGWSGTDRHGLSKVFDDYADPLLVESGLVIDAEDGRRYDRFRERVMFPIRNARGNLIGFGGRILGDGKPKYLNSPETPIFSKGQELYGLWEARQAIREAGVVIVVEGYMDVVGLAQLGIPNAVAALGTSTTPDHVKKLLRASDRVVFSFDGDAAGRRAAWRALQACLPVLRDDINIRFLFLPAEHDPDSYVREFGADAFRAALAEASALSRFLLDELASRHKLGEAEGRASCLHEAAPLLAAIPDCALKVQIERELARQVLLTPEEMSQVLAQAYARQASRGPLPAPGPDALPQPPSRPGDRVDSGQEVDIDTAPFPSWELSGAPDDAGYDEPEPWQSEGDWHGGRGQPPGMRKGDFASRNGQKRPWRGRRDEKPLGFVGRRTMPSLAKRLLCLLLANLALVDGMGDQQLEVLDHDPQLGLVRDLIMLAQSSGARHLGALLQAAEPDSDLSVAVQSLRAEVLVMEDLPNPQDEWNDALRIIERAWVAGELEHLAREGLQTDEAHQRFRELQGRMAILKSAGIR
ncbi:MAG: DNA primase [Bordetella sp.]|uniref:DNA primase n=1 Tax=Bordetella sp. TaxID=28081 RepID=UPI003F7B704D